MSVIVWLFGFLRGYVWLQTTPTTGLFQELALLIRMVHVDTDTDRCGNRTARHSAECDSEADDCLVSYSLFEFRKDVVRTITILLFDAIEDVSKFRVDVLKLPKLVEVSEYCRRRRLMKFAVHNLLTRYRAVKVKVI